MSGSSENRFPAHPKIIFMGTPAFAVPSLKALIDQGHNVAMVITQPDRPKGRGRKMVPPPVKILAMAHQIDVRQPERVSESYFLEQIREIRPDLIIVAAYGQILKKGLLNIPGWGVINIHASLLPKYRGAAPIQHAILNGESETGLTVMRMDEGLDTGPILLQTEVPIAPDETGGQLHDRLAVKSGDIIIQFMDRMAREPIEAIPQDEANATYAPKIEKEMTLIDWAGPAKKVSAQIRALDPVPGAYTLMEGAKIKLFASRIVDSDYVSGAPGRISKADKDLHIETGKGIIEINEIQYPGKKRLSTPDFLRGFPMRAGAVLGG